MIVFLGDEVVLALLVQKTAMSVMGSEVEHMVS